MKKTSSRQKLIKLTTTAVLAALSIVLMFMIRFPIFPAAAFYEMEFADVPILVCSAVLKSDEFGIGFRKGSDMALKFDAINYHHLLSLKYNLYRQSLYSSFLRNLIYLAKKEPYYFLQVGEQGFGKDKIFH